MTLFELKRQAAEIVEVRNAVAKEIQTKAADPTFKMEELRSLKTQLTEHEERHALIMEQVTAMEKEQRAKVETQAVENTEGAELRAKADFIRSTLTKTPMKDETRNLLGVQQSVSTGGENLLPTNMTNTIVSEPKQKNPLRKINTLTNIKGLERPKVDFELEDDAFITDEQTAKEIEMTGDKIVFGRKKFKVKARVSDSVVHGSDLAIVEHVEGALQSGLAVKEKRVSFATSPKSGEEHMSLYHSSVKRVEGATTIEAIINALGDLGDDYQENASVVMRRQDYYAGLKELANGSMDLYKLQPHEVIGAPVEFCELAVKPVVGDFTFLHGNYDGGIVYDSDKDVDKGEYIFVLTAWYDQHKVLSSAFRVAEVTA